MGGSYSRRGFLAALPLAAFALAYRARPLRGSRGFLDTEWCGPYSHGSLSLYALELEHPEPREGVDASKVLTADKLGNPAAAPQYDMIREIPEIADGLKCYCGCAEIPGYRSLFTCFEEKGMAQWCEICLGQANLAYRRHEEGQGLGRIRAAMDALYGRGGD